jgi:hypothetical protein
MSAMSDIYIEVQNAYTAGVKIRDIALNLGIPVNWVFDCLEETTIKESENELFDDSEI